MHSAMGRSQPSREMPGFDFSEAAIDAYKAISLHIRQIFAEYTPIIEPLSLDEAYLDVTENLKGINSVIQICVPVVWTSFRGERAKAGSQGSISSRARSSVLAGVDPACCALCELPNRAANWRTSIRRARRQILEPQTSCTNQPRRLRAHRMPFQVSAMPSPAAATST